MKEKAFAMQNDPFNQNIVNSITTSQRNKKKKPTKLVLAGNLMRLTAYMIDDIILLGIIAEVYMLLLSLYIPQSYIIFIAIFSSSLIKALLFTPFFQKYGGGPGKYIMGLTIVTDKGKKANLFTLYVRESLAKPAMGITLGIGLLMVFFRKDKRGLHDIFAGTKVVKNERHLVPSKEFTAPISGIVFSLLAIGIMAYGSLTTLSGQSSTPQDIKQLTTKIKKKIKKLDKTEASAQKGNPQEEKENEGAVSPANTQEIFKKISEVKSRKELLTILSKFPDIETQVVKYIALNVKNRDMMNLIFTQVPSFIKFLPKNFHIDSLLLEDLFTTFYKAQEFLPEQLRGTPRVQDTVSRYKRKQRTIYEKNKSELLKDMKEIPCCSVESLRLLQLTLEQYPKELFEEGEVIDYLYQDKGFGDKKLAPILNKIITQPNYQLVKYFVAKKIHDAEFVVPDSISSHPLFQPTLKEEQEKQKTETPQEQPVF